MIASDFAMTYPRSLVIEYIIMPFLQEPEVFMIPYPELDSTINRIVKPFQYQVKYAISITGSGSFTLYVTRFSGILDPLPSLVTLFPF